MLIKVLGFSLLIPIAVSVLAEERRASQEKLEALAEIKRLIEHMEQRVRIGMLTFDKIVQEYAADCHSWLSRLLLSDDFTIRDADAHVLCEADLKVLCELLRSFGSSLRDKELERLEAASSYFSKAFAGALEKHKKNGKIYPLLLFGALAALFILII